MGNSQGTHLPCDSCGSSDALTDYETSTYCFSCGEHRFKKRRNPFFKEEKRIDNPLSSVQLPRGACSRFPMEAKQWLMTFHIDAALREKYRIQYVHDNYAGGLHLQNRILLPAYDVTDQKLEFFQARALGGAQPKYLTVGSKKPLFWSKPLETESRSVVLVEDILSAIRIGEIAQAVALVGTSLSTNQLLTLQSKFTILIIWMDGDKEGQAAAEKLRRKCSLVSSQVINIVTEQDPKCLYNADLREKLKPYMR